MQRKIFTIILPLALLLLIGGLAFAGNYFYEYALVPPRHERAPGVPEDVVEEISSTLDQQAKEQWITENAQDVWLHSSDGLQLHAYRADQPGNRYAIVVHGYTSDSQNMANFAKHFYNRGFSVLLPDLRGHGQSEGAYVGMGWHDRLDMLAWIDTLILDDPTAEILLLGVSMGGATVMMTSGETLPENVKLIIEDCGYTSVWDEFSGQLKEQFGLPPFPFLHAASVVTKLRAGYWLSEASAVKQVEKSITPMLFIHGADDDYVPFEMLDILYAAATCEKEKLVIPGAGHGTASSVDPEGYWSAVDTFVDRYM